MEEPLTPIRVDASEVRNLNNSIKEIQQLQEAANNLIADWNRSLTERTRISLELESLARKIARLRLDSDFVKLRTTMRRQDELASKVAARRKELEATRHLLREAQARLRNITVAMDSINADLETVFMSSDRMRLEEPTSDGGGYGLTIRGQQVAPSRVSTGERHALALAYFLNRIHEEPVDDHSGRAATQRLIVIDDPVSSNDLDVQVGLLVMLKTRLTDLLGDKQTQLLILTHDTTVFRNLTKTFDPRSLGKGTVTKGILRPGRNDAEAATIQFGDKAEIYGEYSWILAHVFRYGLHRKDEHVELTPDDYFIGNYMRRCVEAFGTFMFAAGIEAIPNHLPEEQRTRFSGLANRLVMHGLSHFEEMAAEGSGRTPNDLYSWRVKQQMCRQTILLINHLSSSHLRIMLTSKSARLVLRDLLPDDSSQYQKEVAEVIENWDTDLT